jgi:hypothetical protein
MQRDDRENGSPVWQWHAVGWDIRASVAVACSGLGNESQCGTHIMQRDGK